MRLPDGLSVVMPALNEESNIELALASASRMGDRFFERYEIIVVDDGSGDRTAALVTRAAARDPSIRLIRHPRNLGYGAALRTGLSVASLDLVFFTDADNQFDLMELENLLARLPKADAVVGFRLHRSEGLHRRFSMTAWRMVVRAALGLSFRDIDCAFKLFPRAMVQGLTLQSSGAMISAEILVRLCRAGFRIEEVGVSHFPRTGGRATGMSPRVILRAFQELVALRRQL